jgi:hypothetical protein
MSYTYRGTGRDVQDPASTKCGTNGGYQTHVLRKTPKCQPCKEAHAEAARAWRCRPTMRTTCGTHPGYMRHKRASEDACDICLVAYAQYMRDYRTQKRVA